MNNDVDTVVDKCERCPSTKLRRGLPKPPLRPIRTSVPFERVQIDYTEYDYVDSNTGKHSILTMIDCFTKRCWAEAFTEQTGYNTALFLNNTFQHLKMVPETLQCDNGSNLSVANVVKDLLELFNVRVRNSRVKHPETNGQIERFNGTLKRNLRELAGNGPWYHHLQTAVQCYNESMHSTIKCRPIDLWEAYHPTGEGK